LRRREASRSKRRVHGHADLDALTLLHDLRFGELARPAQDAFRQAEAEGEIFEVLRRGHHHHMGDAVVDEGDRNLDGNGLHHGYPFGRPIAPGGHACQRRAGEAHGH
jgi:hypothetical protein